MYQLFLLQFFSLNQFQIFFLLSKLLHYWFYSDRIFGVVPSSFFLCVNFFLFVFKVNEISFSSVKFKALFYPGFITNNMLPYNLEVKSYLLQPFLIIFWEFLTFYQIFFSSQVKRYANITYKHGWYASCLTSWWKT